MGKQTDRQTEQRRGHSAERLLLAGTLMLSGCAQAPEAQPATDYLAGINSFDEVPVSEGASVRTSERGVVVEERFTREIDPELVRAREAQVRALVAEYREERDARDVLREDLASRGDAMVQITFNMPETGLPDISRLARENEVTRRNRIAERQLITSEAQEGYVAELREVGAGAISQLWLTNAISTELPASVALEFWARHPEASVSLNGTILPEFDGVAVRSSTGPAVGRFVGAGLNGDPAGTPRYRVGIIEATGSEAGGENWPLQNHAAFRESAADSTSRIQNVEDCNSCVTNIGFCIAWGCAPTAMRGGTDHGNRVSWLAVGSIEEGQDPAVANATERVRRSGAAPEAVADYYGIRDCDAVPRAIQRAVERGTDVVNLSFRRPEGGICNRDGNCSGVNEAIRNATNAGLIVVKSAGNQATNATDCSLTYPAWRPEVIAVGGLQAGPLALPVYSSAPRDPQSSVGGVQVRYTIPTGTFTATAASLGLMSWGSHQVTPRTATSPIFDVVTWYSGTSFAAPTVTGTTALMAHSMSPDGIVYWPGQTITNMLLLGDASAPENSPSGKRTIGLSNQFGFGRMRATTGAAMTAPWGWGSRTISGGVGTRTFSVNSSGPESPLTREWRWVTASFENDLNQLTNDYTIRVVDACPPSGGRVTVAWDSSFDPRKRIELNQAEICPAGRPTCRCLEMEVIVNTVGPNGLTIHSSDFFHGGDPNVF